MKTNQTYEATFTPYTLDTYSTFTFESAEELIMDDDKNSNYDDLDWKYDKKGYLQALADNYIKLLNDNILDDVILKVTAIDKPYSPREYNFTTDNLQLSFDLDLTNLEKYIKDNQEDFDKNKIASCDGFMYLGDDIDTMLHYYLHHESIKNYSPFNYYMDQLDDIQADEFITTKKIIK